MTNDFVIVGDTISRPDGLERLLLDALCRWTGHLLRSNGRSQYQAPTGGLFRTSYCYRCWRWGYCQGDYWPTDGQ